MNSQILILSLFFSISFVSISAYADHPDAIIVTLDKESYDFGDTIFGTAQLIAPWNSTAWEGSDIDTLVSFGSLVGEKPLQSELNHDTGIITFNYTLLSSSLEAKTYEITTYFHTYLPFSDREGIHIHTNHQGMPFNIILNTDLITATVQNLHDIPLVNNTAQTNMITIQETQAEMHAMHDDMILIDDTIIQQNTLITLLNNTITSLHNTILNNENSINILAEMVEELLSQVPPLPLDAPIITAVIADDPDNLDNIFSTDDTITILFDSETNLPLGSGTLTKSKINELFTFSDKIGQAYSGTWTNSSAFTISINSAGNSELLLNSTTVTPAQTTPILPADNNQENFSHETSPALTGDWGIQ